MRHLWMSVLLGAACASETTGERVRVHWVLDPGIVAEHAELETQAGYRVTLEEARIDVQSLYLYAPPSARLGALAWLERGFSSVAHAHGGIDNEKGRRVLAEWTKPLTIDALSGAPVELSYTDAEGGTVDAVKLLLKDGAVARVRGQAERDGQRWRFEAEVTPDEDVARSVELIELEEALEANARVHIRVEPKVWLDLCEFSRLVENAADEVITVQADNQVGRALSIGVRSPSAFSVYIGQEG